MLLRELPRSPLLGILLMAVLYIVSGKLGLLLALPPGYATLVWPPSGIAMGMLMMGGRRLWPGIWLGSLLLNCHASNTLWPFHEPELSKVAIAALIATGSTLQALLAYSLLQRWRSFPINLHSMRDVFIFLLVAAPISCLAAASVGVTTLAMFEVIAPSQLWHHWLTWWAGDMLGVLIFLPMMALLPWRPFLLWRGARIKQVPILGLILIMLPVGISLYAWKICAAYEYQQSQARFEEHVRQRERLLIERLNAFEYGLRGAAAYVPGSEIVTQQEWKNYVETLDIRRGFPGAMGFGLIQEIAANHSAHAQPNGQAANLPRYVVTHAHPVLAGVPAVGWNIARQPEQREAAQAARDKGVPVLSEPMPQGKGTQSNMSLVLYYPFYAPGKPLGTIEERRQALAGWTYVPLQLSDVLQSIQAANAEYSSVEIHRDGLGSTALYRDGQIKKYASAHTVRQTLSIHQQEWTFVWHSTPGFDHASRLRLSILVLAGGLFFSLIFAIFIFSLNLGKLELSLLVRRRIELGVPLALFLLVLGGTLVLHHRLQRVDAAYRMVEIQGKAALIVQHLQLQVKTNERSLQRMARRLGRAPRAYFTVWKADAAQFVEQLPGVRMLEWIDAKDRIRWVEPLAGNEQMVGMHAAGSVTRAAWLKQARTKELSYTQALRMRQGYPAVIGYFTLMNEQSFLGFLAAVMDLEVLFGSISRELPVSGYAIAIRQQGVTYLQHKPPEALSDVLYTHTFDLLGSEWDLQLIPSQQLLAQQKSGLPWVVLGAGIFMALLSALTLYSMLRSYSNASALTARKAQLRLLIKHTPAAVAMFDRHLHYIACSDRWVGDYKLEDMHLIGRHLYDVFPEMRSMPQWIDIHQRAMGGEVFPLREDTWWRAGSQEWIQWAIHPWRESDGSVGGIIIFSEVITPRIEAAKALQTSEETLRQSFEHSPIGMALVGLQGQWLRVNDALCDMLGYAHDDLLALNFQSLTYAEDLHTDEVLVREVLSGARRNYQLEKRYVRQDGSIVWAMLHVSLVRNAAGEPHYFVSQVEDIDERKKSEQAHQLLIQKLAESNTELERFAYVASHDLREPARLISSYAELLEQEYADTLDATAQKYIAICSRAAQRMHSLITDLLNYARVGRAAEKLQMFAVEDCLDYVRDMLATSIDAKRAVITHQALPTIQGNKTSFSLLLQNLIANALKYSHANRTPHIHLACVEKEGAWEFSVRDNGIGIKPEFFEQIFEPFKRLHSGDAYEGTGMGLAICRKIVAQKGGVIWLQSVPGEGTVFYFTIPKTAARNPSDPV